MVQVLENKFVSLDVMPGTDLVEAQRQLRQQMAAGQTSAQIPLPNAGNQSKDQVDSAQGTVQDGKDTTHQQATDQLPKPVDKHVDNAVAFEKRGAEGNSQQTTAAGGPQKIPEDVYEGMNDEQKEQAKGMGAVIVDGTGKVLYGLGSTLGGVVKGVGDTAFNVVYDVGAGLGKVGTGAVGGLYETAKVPFESGENKGPKAGSGQSDSSSVSKDKGEGKE